jgi:prepilin-type N-terminal cleavage/methylation domain-containing protein
MHRAGQTRRPPLSYRTRLGFTLTELVVVVVCLAIAGYVVVPEFAGSEASRLSAAASMLVADLELTQAQSMSHNDSPRVIVFNAAANRYFIAAKSSPQTPLTTSIGEPLESVFGRGRAAALQGVTIQYLDVGADNMLGFRAQGDLDQATAATIRLACGGRTVTITIDPLTGQASTSNIQ